MDTDAVRRYFERRISENEFYDWIGVRIVTVEEGRVVGEMPFDDHLSPPSPPGPETIHGGVLSTLVDLGAIGATLSTVSEPGDAFITTAELQVDFIEPVETAVRADAVVTGRDGRTVEVRVEVVRANESDGTPVATGRATCLVSETARRESIDA